MAIPSRPEEVPAQDEFDVHPVAWMILGLIIFVSATVYFFPEG